MEPSTWRTCTSGVLIPPLLYGTAWKKEATADCVHRALSHGFRGIDTACQPKHYDEAGVGAGVAAFLAEGAVERSVLYLQTKFTPLAGQDPQRLPYAADAPLERQVEQSVETSLRNLRTRRLDCLVLHSPLPDPDDMATVWNAMEAMVDAGHVRQLGISNCYSPALFEALRVQARIPPAVLQNRFYEATGYDAALRADCRKHGIIYQSFWTLTANRALLEHPTLQGIAARHGRTPAQVLFRYLSQEGVVPLTGTQSDAHMQEDLAIFEFALDEGEREALGGLL